MTTLLEGKGPSCVWVGGAGESLPRRVLSWGWGLRMDGLPRGDQVWGRVCVLLLWVVGMHCLLWAGVSPCRGWGLP